jgi:hypothetical protein
VSFHQKRNERREGAIIATNKTNKQHIYGYLRVSIIDQDIEKNKSDILSFANAKGILGEVEFIEDKVSSLKSWKKRKLNDLVQSMNKGDVLLGSWAVLARSVIG